MQKPLRILALFMAFLLASTDLFGMKKKVRGKRRRKAKTTQVSHPSGTNHVNNNQKDEVQEQCPICQNVQPIENLHVLHCTHKFCKTCFGRYIDTQRKRNIVLKCPACTRELSLNDYNINSTDHVKSAIKTFAIPAALAVGGLYTLYKYLNKKTAKGPNRPSGAKKNDEKIHASDIVVPTLASAGLFALLTIMRTDPSTSIKSCLFKALGQKHYINLKCNTYGNLALTLINKHVVNGGLSLVGGLSARYCYKLFSGEDYKPKKQSLYLNKK